MDYWNQQNFAGLKAIGQHFAGQPDFELFARYCLLKEQGLKKPALSAIQQFVATLKASPAEHQRSTAITLTSLAYHHQAVHQLLAHPLAEFLKDVFRQWLVVQPDNIDANTWLGYLSGDISYYKNVLNRQADNEVCIAQLSKASLNNLSFQTHHLSESCLLGEIDDAFATLSYAQDLLARLEPCEIKTTLLQRFAEYQTLLDSWQRYVSLGLNEPFPQWFAKQGQSIYLGYNVYFKS